MNKLREETNNKYFKYIQDKGDNVLIWKDAHPCHANAVRLAGAEAIVYDLEIDREWGIPLETDPEMIERYLKAYEIKAVIVTSPTYEGIVSDIRKIKKISAIGRDKI